MQNTPQHTSASVLSFLEKEFKNFAESKLAWELERNDLKKTIATLEEIRLRKENTEAILMRKIKMLEYALRNERNVTEKDEIREIKVLDPIKIPFSEKKLVSDETKEYLRVLNASDAWNLISKSGNIVPNLMGIDKEIAAARVERVTKTVVKEPVSVVETTKAPAKETEQDFSHVSMSKSGRVAIKNFQEEKRRFLESEGLSETTEFMGNFKKGDTLPIPKPISTGEREEFKISLEKEKIEAQVAPKLRESLNLNLEFYSHLQGVRSISWHPTLDAFVTGSEDCTVKFWSTRKKNPIHTYRGHTAPVFSVVCDESVIYSAGAGGEIRVWDKVVETPPFVYGVASALSKYTLNGHKDGVWSMSLDSQKTGLLSASADQTVKFWNVKDQKCSKTIDLPSIPTCVGFVPSNSAHFVSSHVDGLNMYDLETGKNLWGVKDSHINQMVIHPTLPLVISAHEDKKLKYWDLSNGKMISEGVAHADGVTCLSIDQTGMVLLSGSHDSSLRMWDISSKLCIQEKNSRFVKHDESILCIDHHSTIGMVAVSGANGVVRVGK